MDSERASCFNLSFRPDPYDSDKTILRMLIDTIQGQARREIAALMLKEGRIDELHEVLLAEQLPMPERQIWGRIDPRLMGGEYLPPMDDDEWEIARIVLQSVTQDVASIRARKVAEGWRYRFVDEYESTYLVQTELAPHPLTMAELIALIDTVKSTGIGYILPILEMNLENEEGDPEELRDFVSVTSSFYPELGEYYDSVIASWIRGKTES